MTCPVVRAISEITGAGLYHDEDDKSRLIKIGGSDSEITYVCDNASFYFTKRRLELARFELRSANPPTPAEIAAKYDKLYGKIAGLPYTEAVQRLTPDALDTTYLRRQLICAADSLSVICGAIVRAVAALAANGQCVNVSLPTLYLDEDTLTATLSDPARLRDAVNRIVDFNNGLNISSIVSYERRALPQLPEFTGKPPTGTIFRPPNNDAADIRALSTIEDGLASYFNQLEVYHCEAIRLMARVIDQCKHIVQQLAQLR